MKPSNRLAARGLALPSSPPPAGSYVAARRVGNVIYTAGQLPMVDGVLTCTGVVGDESGHVTVARASECAVIALVNAVAAAAHLAGGVDAITGVVRLTGYVASAPGFTGHPSVLNAASELLADVFGESGRHARSAVGVSSLPLGSPVEVELIVEVADASSD
ncbi:MAG: LysR family transcriptional regulator [Actinobacteria bacterium HGW-Actinobacteria-4]|nr:MAG: LysR family transcriptional regulator [Actinobacteria bacterium HGW-Actinobacteria-4]